MDRRAFLASGAGAAMMQSSGPRFRKSICSIIFPAGTPWEECFRRAKNAGFEGIELPLGEALSPETPAGQLKPVAEAARKNGIAIVSVWCSAPLSANPLNSADAALRARGVEVVRKCLHVASTLECGAMLLVPGRLGSGAKFQTGYQDTWNRVSAEMRKLVGEAARERVIITPENVWNKFLVSPLEMRAFVDQFRSPWVGVSFDTGNVMQFGYPQDWILTLGSRIRRLHAKDYKLSTRAEQGRFVDLLEGDVDWKEVMAALVKVGYHGFVSPEIGHNAGDPDQLMKVSRALDKILAMA